MLFQAVVMKRIHELGLFLGPLPTLDRAEDP
jgi:hypothetical protein